MIKSNNIYEFRPKRTREEIAIERYREGKLSDPIFQLYTYDLIVSSLKIWSHLEGLIILYIYKETISKNIDRAAIGAGDMAYELGADRRGIQRLRDKLAEEGWIDVRESECRNRIKLNLDKIMALGKKYTEKKQRNESASGGMSPPLDKKSNIIYDNIPNSSREPATVERQEILDKARRRRREPKISLTKSSLSHAWKNTFEDYYPDLHCKITELDKNKLSLLTGNRRCQGRWKKDAIQLHEITKWSISNYEFLRSKLKFLPLIPSIGYFVTHFDKIYGIWLEDQKSKLEMFDEKVVEFNKSEEWKPRFGKWNIKI